jgi:hypothetical protein
MKGLKVGDRILDGAGKPTTVQGWMHREPENRMKTVIINNKLEVSVDHLISTPKGYVFAGELKPGDEVMAGGVTLFVSSVVPDVGKGVYAPYTASGTMLVDGVSVSCFADFYHHGVSHYVMWAQYWTGLMTSTDTVVRKSTGHGFVRTVNWVFPSLFFK